MTTDERIAIVWNTDEATVANYLPANYRVLAAVENPRMVLIAGKDSHGWTLDDYVIPRLASGLHFAKEVVR